MFDEVKKIAVPVAIILAAAVYFGVIGAGPQTPKALIPTN